MTTLLAEVAATYDFVLIDSPPVSAVAEPLSSSALRGAGRSRYSAS
jgi:Mrp family chromosome partitioning ATPase